MDLEGRRRHRRDDLARRLQPLAPARPRRLFHPARLERLCRGRQGLRPDRACRARRFNRVEIRGAAYGALDYAADGKRVAPLAQAPAGRGRAASTAFADDTGGTLRFTNVAQETPIQEIWAYDVGAGAEPKGTLKLSYTVDAEAAAGLRRRSAPLNDYIAGRYPARRARHRRRAAGRRRRRPRAGAGSAAPMRAARRAAATRRRSSMS